VVDRNAMKIVFNNLIENAIKYSIEPVKININLSRISKKIYIRLSDKGIGINPDELKKVFNKFYRIYDINIPTVKGTGLGLYWVKEIIKTHGGKITALSEGKNKGSTFRIELPVFQISKKRFLDKLLRNTSKRNEISENKEVGNYV
jgi:signal transduction histidine kinase